jgi:hypothetical protein
MTMEELRFYGSVRSVFEQMTGAVLPGNEANVFLSGIHKEYVASGSPNPAKKWVENTLSKMVLAVAEMPAWQESIKHTWPFHNGRPMIFLANLAVPDTPVAREYAAPSVQLLLFGIRIQVEGGWSMEYTVIEQHSDL